MRYSTLLTPVRGLCFGHGAPMEPASPSAIFEIVLGHRGLRPGSAFTKWRGETATPLVARPTATPPATACACAVRQRGSLFGRSALRLAAVLRDISSRVSTRQKSSYNYDQAKDTMNPNMMPLPYYGGPSPQMQPLPYYGGICVSPTFKSERAGIGGPSLHRQLQSLRQIQDKLLSPLGDVPACGLEHGTDGGKQNPPVLSIARRDVASGLGTSHHDGTHWPLLSCVVASIDTPSL
jgi:hypothetical protein